MSKETLDLMLSLNRQELEIQIALQCAPLLTGRKIDVYKRQEEIH